MVAAPSQVLVSSAAVFHCLANVMVGLPHVPPLDRAHVLPQPLVLIVHIHGPGKGVAGVRIHRQRAAIDGAGDGASLPGLVGHMGVVSPEPGCAAMRVQVTPSADW